MTLVPGERTLAPGQNELEVRFESRRSAASSWSRPTPSSAAATSIDVQHEIVNDSARAGQPAPVPAAGARRQCRRRAARASTRPSPARRSTPTTTSSRRSTSRTSRRARPATSPIRDRGRQRLGRDGPALLRLGLAGRQARRAGAAARVLHRARSTTNHVLGRRCSLPVGEIAPGATQDASTPSCSPARRKKTSSPRSRPASNWSRTTASSRSSPSRCSGC